MIKILIFLFFLVFFNNNQTLSKNNFEIIIKVNNKIVTNYDILKEIEYLKILNPGLNELNEEEILQISKQSLIKQLIKEIEIEKYINLNKETKMLKKVYSDLISRLNFENENQFKELLISKKSYSTDEIKKKLKIELFWNDIIFSKFKNQLKINEEDLLKKIKAQRKPFYSEYFLSEIFFKTEKSDKIDNLVSKINTSIKEIGFNNTANIYSVSESAKFGGKLGWINENNLSKNIFESIKNINVGEHTNPIKIGNNFLILKIENIRTKEIKINHEKQLAQMINFERNKQLTQFSNIYFNKVKINNYIDEK